MVEASEVFDGIFERSQGSLQNAVSSVEDDPEKAARAIKLGQDAGVAPSVVYGDMERFESNHKAQLTSQLLQSNPHLSDYIASHPMAAKVSNDDWANLDNVSQALDKHGTGLLSKVAEGFKEGVGEGGIGSWIKPEDVAKYPVGSIGWALIGAPIEVPMRLLSGVFKGAQVGAEELGQAAGMDRSSAKRLSRDLLGMTEYQLQQTPGKGTGVPKFGEAISQSIQAAKPWLYAGKEPPLGLDKQIDELKKQQSAEDLKSLDELTREAQSSATRERAPELFENFIALKNKGSIGISADAIIELYGNKKPHPEDNILGWVPDLEKQLWPALASGGDIEIPLATWLARVEPEVAKELHDHIRVRKGGITKAEGEVLSQSLMVEAYHGSPHEFDAFSMEKIGTGEGAQSYGHGLYFAESQGVAKSYAEMEKRKAGWTSTGNDYENVPEGNLYRVRIHADKEQFLDWDKELGQQEPHVQQAIDSLQTKHPDWLASVEEYLDERGQSTDLRDFTGNQFYQILQKWASEDSLPGVIGDGTNLKKEASDFIKSLGIPGIKYLDQGSRPTATKLADLQKSLDSMQRQLADAADVTERAFLETKIAEIEGLIRGNESPTYNFVLFDDSLIEITYKNDQAVQGVRKAAGLEPLFEEPIKQELRTKTRQEMTGDVLATVKDTYNKNEREINIAVNDILDRIVGDKVERGPSVKLEIGGEQVQGVYSAFTGRKPLIQWSLSRGRPEEVARHEAIHHLREYGFFKEGEWDTLVAAAMDGDWIKKHDIERLYEGASKETKFEEAIAEEFSTWYKNEKPGHPANAIFERIKQLLIDIKDAIAKVLGHEPTYEELFTAAETGLLKERGPQQESMHGSQKLSRGQGELDVTRQEDKKLFATIAGWMNKAQQEKYMSLINKQRAEDAEFMLKKAERIERAKQTAEWKQAEGEIRGEVEADIGQRPDLGALEFFRTGKLYGEETGTRPRVDPMQLTEEQRKAFPEKYQRRDGMALEDVAQLFGYIKFDDLAAKLQILDQEVGNKTTSAFMKSIVDAEVERRMVAKFGDLEENILREAQEHVISDTQMDLLHEEVVALGMKTGSEMTFTKADFRRWVEEKFKDVKANEVSLEGYLRDAGKAGRDVEAALLKEDPTLAFQQKQRQLLAMLLAEQAKKFEKEQGQFERLAKRFSKRVVKGVEQPFTDWIQKILLDAGNAGTRTANELQEATLRSGRSLSEFVDFHKHDGWDLQVSMDLQEGRIRSMDQMSVDQYQEYKESLDSLAWVGAKQKKIIVGGEAMDRAAYRKEILDNITQLPIRDKSKPNRAIYAFDAILTKKEEIFKDLDLRQEFGPLFRAIVPAIADSNHTQFSLIEKLTKDLKGIKGNLGKEWQRSLRDDISNDWWVDPHDGTLFDLNREHMLNIMVNFGNRSNIEKFTKGYAGKDQAAGMEARLRQMFEQHATPADLEYVQKMWDIFEQWRPQISELYYELSGVPPKWIEAEPLTVGGTTIKGGYYPVIWDRLRSHNIYGEKETEVGRYGSNYIRATPSNSYTKTRTGAVDAIEFFNPMDQIASRMNQVIHDISFRRTVMEVGKIIDDPAIRKAIEKHYGIEYADQLKPWLNRMANQFSVDEKSLASVNTWMRRTRMAMLINTLGANLGVIASPAIGKLMGPAAFRYGLPLTEKRAINQAEMLAKSRELNHSFQNIDRDYREALEATIKGNKLDEFQANAVKFAFYPTVKVDQYFREITFHDEYTKYKAEGRSEGESIALADSAVRERHGSGADANLPRIMQGSEALKMATMFYGWFNTSYNWQRQIPGQLRRGEYQAAAQTAWFAVLAPTLMFGWIFTDRKEGESIFSTMAKSLVLQAAGTVPLVREVANKFIEGHSARAPWTALIDAGYAAYGDIRRKLEGKKVEKPFRHAANVIGMTPPGLPLGQVGKTGQFIQDVASGQSNKQPRNMWEWIRGMVWGEARLKKGKK